MGRACPPRSLQLAEARIEADAHGVVALAAIRNVFSDAEALHTTTIVEKLNADEQLPFGDYRKGAGLNESRAGEVAQTVRRSARRT